VAFTIDRQEDLVEVPLITWPRKPATELIRVLLAKLTAPFADRFVRHDHTTDEQQFFHVAVAERKAEIQPDGVADDLSWEPMMCARIGQWMR